MVVVPDTASVMPHGYEYGHLIHPATLDAITQLAFGAIIQPCIWETGMKQSQPCICPLTVLFLRMRVLSGEEDCNKCCVMSHQLLMQTLSVISLAEFHAVNGIPQMVFVKASYTVQVMPSILESSHPVCQN